MHQSTKRHLRFIVWQDPWYFPCWIWKKNQTVPQLHSIENVKVALIAYNTNIFHVCSANRPAKHYLILGDSTAGRAWNSCRDGWDNTLAQGKIVNHISDHTSSELVAIYFTLPKECYGDSFSGCESSIQPFNLEVNVLPLSYCCPSKALDPIS